MASRPLDALVCGLPRSGTTLLCDLMTWGDDHACANEPDDLQMDAWRTAEWPTKNFAIKQVRWPMMLHALDWFRPEKLIVVARNIAHVVLSHIEWQQRRRPERLPEQMFLAVEREVVTVSRYLAALADIHPPIVVHYEKLVRGELRDSCVGWQLNGVPRPNQNEWEYKRHDGQVTARSIDLRENQLTSSAPETIAFIERLQLSCANYTEKFLS